MIMFVMLLGSIANAQTFDFSCDPATVESELTAIYAADAPPTELGDLINNTSDTVEASTDSSDFFKSLGADSGYTVASFSADEIGFYFRIDAIDTPKIYSEVGDINTPASHRAFTLQIVKHIWDLLYPNYAANVAFTNALEAIYTHGHPPTELGTIINDAALAVEYGIAGITPRKNFMKSLAYFNVTVSNVFDSNSEPAEVHLSNGNVIPNVGTNANVNGMTPAQFAVFAFEVVKRFWHIGHPTYAADQAKAQLRAERTETVKMLGNGYADVRVSLDNVEGNIIGISDTDGEQYIYVQLYDLSNQTGFVGLEDLQEGEFTLLKNAITAKVNELTPTVAKELAAWFADTVNAPTGAAPDYLPTALYAKANTLINGTERFAFIADGLLSAHGVTITRGGAGQTGATVTTFILSKGEGYDATINWGDYSEDGFNGNSKASPELYRNLVFDVIKAGWKLVNETHNTERSDWLDQDLDVTGNDVELITYGSPNFDWWIYFNVDGLQIPILSGGIASDPMFYNKHTVNPHDTYMTEVEFQRLVVFITYMRDNFNRLKGQTSVFDRQAEISDLVGSFGAQVSVTTFNDGTNHWVFSKNGISSQPVQSNWSHPAGTSLEDLSPDNWVKFYAKCRGILIGL